MSPSWRLAAGYAGGLVAAWVLGQDAALLRPIADLFVAALTAAGPPVALFALLSSFAALSSGRLARLAIEALAWYIASAIAVGFVGVAAANAFQVGSGFSMHAAIAAKDTALPLANAIRTFGNFVSGPASHIIFWSVLVVLLVKGGRSDAGGEQPLVKRALDTSLSILAWMMRFAPVGVFALAAVTFGKLNPASAFGLLSILGATYAGQIVVTGAAFLMLLLIRMSPTSFLQRSGEALITAFATGSSAATAPVEIATAEDRLKIEPEIVGLALPLGLAVYKIGSAVLLAVTLVFAARVTGTEFTLPLLAFLALLAALASVITPPISGGVLVALAIVAGLAGLPLSLLVVAATVPFAGKLNTPLNSLGRLVSIAGLADRVSRLDHANARLTAATEGRLAGPASIRSRGERP